MATGPDNAPRRARHAVALLAALLLLLAPLFYALWWGAGSVAAVQPFVATVAALGFVLAACALVPPLRWLLPVLLAAAVVVRCFHAGLVHFSGSGFTDEVFLHFGPEAIAVGWMEYRWAVLALAGVLVVVLVVALSLAAATRSVPRRLALVVLVAAAPLLAWTAHSLPEAELASAAASWYGARPLPVSEERRQHWEASGLLQLDLPAKHMLRVQPPPQPRNLILLYLESVGIGLVNHPRHQQLMPNLARLIDRHALVPDFHASAYITIEGITNSQCGTLFPFRRGSDTMASAERLAESLPCLGDVLAQAGYRQSYLGGAGLGFAGKGAFLSAHGYDTLVGIDQWRERGLAERPGTWGLSDADLFEQSHAEIQRLRALGAPFNLTLLTIGTHLPGYSYAECHPYGDGSERFLNAVSCTDQLLGRWLERLQNDGVLQDTLLVITADHNIFPNPEMKRLFGEQVALDRRLPLVVVGADSDAAVARGAGYDLAPTVLDLLDIDHDARFALGRSLLRPEARRGGFFRKYENIIAGSPESNGRCEGKAAGPVTLPLAGCEKKELLELLAMQQAVFSLSQASVACDGPARRNRLLLPAAAGEPFELTLGGREQSQRFTWNSRPADPADPGLYRVAFDATGGVLSRHHVPAARAGTAEPATDPRAVAVLAIWLGAEDARHLRPGWLPEGDTATDAWLLSLPARAVLARASHGNDGRASLLISPGACQRAFAASADS